MTQYHTLCIWFVYSKGQILTNHLLYISYLLKSEVRKDYQCFLSLKCVSRMQKGIILDLLWLCPGYSQRQMLKKLMNFQIMKSQIHNPLAIIKNFKRLDKAFLVSHLAEKRVLNMCRRSKPWSEMSWDYFKFLFSFCLLLCFAVKILFLKNF